MEAITLQKILEEHGKWVHREGGERADLLGADLRGANLSGANLSGANLRRTDLNGAKLNGADLLGAVLLGADLSGADLSRANLKHADLRGAHLNGAHLIGADLSGADLQHTHLNSANLMGADLVYADLMGADLRGADLRGADLSDANLNFADLNGVVSNADTAMYNLQCPEEGSYIAWKKCNDGVLVKLLIPEDALRSSATSRKCRASKAIVLEVVGAEYGVSSHDNTCIYKVGETVEALDFDTNRWETCSAGIHHFITRSEAESY